MKYGNRTWIASVKRAILDARPSRYISISDRMAAERRVLDHAPAMLRALEDVEALADEWALASEAGAVFAEGLRKTVNEARKR